MKLLYFLILLPFFSIGQTKYDKTQDKTISALGITTKDQTPKVDLLIKDSIWQARQILNLNNLVNPLIKRVSTLEGYKKADSISLVGLTLQNLGLNRRVDSLNIRIVKLEKLYSDLPQLSGKFFAQDTSGVIIPVVIPIR